MPKLKNRQHEEFCQQWIIDFNAARAAQVAGGCKERKAARVTGCHWLARADVSKRIAELLKDRSERTQITQDMVIRELAILGFSDFRHYGQVKKGGDMQFIQIQTNLGGIRVAPQDEFILVTMTKA